MKKLLLIGLIGLAAIACKKDDNNLQSSNNNNNSNDSTNVVDTTNVIDTTNVVDTTNNDLLGNWISTAQSTDLTVSGTTFALDANGNTMFDSITFMPILTDTSYTESEQVDPDSLDPKSLELLSNGNAIFTDMDNNTDTFTYEHVGSNLNILVPEGAMDGSDTTVVFNIQNLTSSTLVLQMMAGEQSFTDADLGLPTGTGIDFVMTYSVNWSFSK